MLGVTSVGCSNSSKTNETTATKETTQGSSTEANSMFNEVGTLPIVKEPITLTVFSPANGEFSWEDNVQTKELEEKTGIHIEWQMAASSDNVRSKLSTVFASGDMPDIIFTGVGASSRYDKASELALGVQGLVIPLNDYLDTISVGYKQAFEKSEGLKDFITTPEGKIYSLPNLDASLHVQHNLKLWLNTKWLKNLGLNMPTTTEEFEKVLLAFKEKDANGNGDPNDEISLSTVTTGSGVQIDGFLMAPYQLTPEGTKLYLDKGKITYAPTQEKYKEGLKWLHKLYEEGIIYPESFTQDKNTQVNLNESGEEPVIGAFLAQRPGYACDLTTYPNNSEKWEQYQSLSPLTGPDGTKQAAWNPYIQYQSGMVFITSSCKNPEAAFRFLDYLATDEMSMRSAMGVEGEEWRKATAGELGLDGKPALYAIIPSTVKNKTWGQLACLIRTEEMVNGMAVAQDPYADDVKPLDGRQIVLYQASLEHQKVRQPMESVVPDLYMTSEDSAEMALLKTTINDTQNQLMTQFITGALDIDKNWSSYISQLESAGLSKYLELWQKAYDASSYAK